MHAALSYNDSLEFKPLPDALAQDQRDFFGVHAYTRVEKVSTFHTLLSGDRTEIDTRRERLRGSPTDQQRGRERVLDSVLNASS